MADARCPRVVQFSILSRAFCSPIDAGSCVTIFTSHDQEVVLTLSTTCAHLHTFSVPLFLSLVSLCSTACTCSARCPCIRLPLFRPSFLSGLTPVKNRYTQSNEIISGVKAMETPGTGLFRSSLASGAITGLDPKFQDQVSGPATCIECACLRIC